MANKKWYQNILPVRQDAEIKSLQNKLDLVVEEFKDNADYDAKFYDAEPSSGSGMSDLSGVDQIVNSSILQKLFLSETWVYVAVMAISKTIAGLPVKGEKRTKVKRTIINDVTGEAETVEQELWVDASGEKIFQRFNNPNKFTSKEEFFMLLCIDLLTCGQFYVWLDSDVDLTTVSDATNGDANSPFARLRAIMASDTPIRGMYRIPPAMIKPLPSESGMGVEVYAMESAKGSFGFNPAEIVHVKLPNPANQFEGLSPLVAAFKPVLLDRFSTEHIIRFYKSGARLGGIIETEKSLNKEQLGRFQRSFENNYTGRQNHHRTLILPPGMTYKAIEANPAETALLDFCKYNRETILAAYNVPPIKVGIMDHANYANALVQLKIFFEDTIKPLLTFIEGGFNLKTSIFPDSQTYRIKFDLSQVEALKENFKEKAEAAKFMIDAGLTINEVRKQVWNVGPLVDGDKCKVIEDIKSGVASSSPIFASAPEGQVKTPVDQADAPAIASDINPTNATFNDRVNQLVAEFMAKGDTVMIAVPKAIAQALAEGLTPDDDGGGDDPKGGGSNSSGESGEGSAPADAKDGEGGGLSSAVQGVALIPTMIGNGKPKKPKKPKKDDEEEKAEKPSLEQFISDSISKLHDDEVITPDLITDLMAIYAQEYGETVDAKELSILTTETSIEAKETAVPEQRQNYSFGLTKDHVVEHWKGFIDKTNPLIVKRTYEVQKFFKEYKSVVLNKLGANIKSYGLHKSRDEDDIEEILSPENFDRLLKQYAAEVDKALADAYKMGYADTLGTFEFTPPNETALAQLKAYAADKVTKISDTTREQLQAVLSDAFEEGVAMGEVSSRIQDKFAEMSQGRALTIARTETLTAVSMGREEKRQDWQKEFPERKLVKMWISSQDDKVRDSHQEYDGVVVDAGAEFADGLKFPRDPDCGDPAEVINCRCTDITFDSEDEGGIRDQLPELTDEEVDTLDEEKSIESDTENKGGPGSGRHYEGGRKPYDRKPTKVGPEKIKPVERTNKLDQGANAGMTNSGRMMDLKGADVTAADAAAFSRLSSKEVQANVNVAVDRAIAGFAREGITIEGFKVRAKDAASLQTKMNDKWPDKTLNQVTDGIGIRFVVADQKSADLATIKLERVMGMKVLEHDDKVDDSKNTGYRAQQLLVRTPGGMIAEVQIKTQNQDTWSRWGHDGIYKNDKLKNDASVQTYAKQVSERLHSIDNGKPVDDKLPEAPQAVKDAGLEFPWVKVKS